MKQICIVFLALLLLAGCGSKLPDFDGEKSFEYLVEQCELGYRYPGTEEIKLCREYIIEKLQDQGAVVELQRYTVEVNNQKYEGVNILASYYPELSRRILLGAHYDTRPWADKDPDMANHSKPVLGANDGASGVAVLLEISRIAQKEMPPEQGIDLVFFDLEDMGSYTEDETWCLGSRYFAEHYQGAKPEKAIIVDMIGDAELEIPIEYFSYHNSPLLVREVWDTAVELGIQEFKPGIEKAIQDDHYPLIQAGFNAIDIIDFDYKWWHTVEDTPDKCSAASLEKVGEVLVKIIYR